MTRWKEGGDEWLVREVGRVGVRGKNEEMGFMFIGEAEKEVA